MSEGPRVVAVGLLTQRDLDILGQEFDRVFPIGDADCFEELLRAIDEAERRLEARTKAASSSC